ncbi:MAG: hypothetical protein QOJ41_1905 [Acidobacteriaceae bacterium]|jgi:hypothetical protein|nr:hypothetical protein [Acidobacteriaceae bacterium]
MQGEFQPDPRTTAAGCLERVMQDGSTQVVEIAGNVRR